MNAGQAIFPLRAIVSLRGKIDDWHLHNLNSAPIYFFLMSDC